MCLEGSVVTLSGAKGAWSGMIPFTSFRVTTVSRNLRSTR
jgi:hypothetical protein